MVRILSVNREPLSLWLPKHPLRHRTAPRKALSARLLVGSTPGTKAKVSNAGQSFKRLRHRASALGSPQEAPRRNSFPKRVRTGTSSHRISAQVISPILITMPDGKEPFDLSESPGSHRTGPGLPLGERLKISLQMRPADLALDRVHHIIGAPAIAVENARKSFTDKFHQGFAASGARTPRRPSPLWLPPPTASGVSPFPSNPFHPDAPCRPGPPPLWLPGRGPPGPRRFLRTDSGCFPG